MSAITKEEFANRSMHRLLATATHGPQPQREGEATEIRVTGRSGRRVSVAFTLADTEAVITELDLDAPCGICHENPCSYGRLP